MTHKKIYLDYAATTPLEKRVFSAMKPYLGENFGNASSLHFFGQKAAEAVEKARRQAADFFGANENEIIFTSGATESNNLAIKGTLRAWREKSGKEKGKPHIITSAIEHHCVLNTVKNLEKEGLIEATYLLPKTDGVIEANKIAEAIKPNTLLVSVMYVNNEIGTVQPLAEIGKIIAQTNFQRDSRIIFHTDATQAINYFDCQVEKLGVDLLSMSAHKIYGPKGAGALYVKKGTPLSMIQDGGEQEMRKRAGTLNVPGIVGLAQALAEVKSSKLKVKNKIKKSRNYFIARVLKEIPDVRLNGSKKLFSPAIVNFSFKNVEGESLLLMLSQSGIAVSTGSACSSGSLEPSHVLLAIGLRAEEAHGSIRFSLGKFTTQKEIDYAVKKTREIVGRLRKISGSVLSDYYKDK